MEFLVHVLIEKRSEAMEFEAKMKEQAIGHISATFSKEEIA